MSGLTGKKTVKLSFKDKKEIERILKSKQVLLRVYKRAKVLKLVSSGYSQAQAALLAGVSESTGKRICANYRQKGLKALDELARCGRPSKLTDKQKQRAVAMICSKPPKGLSRWTVRITVKELKRRGIISSIGRNTVWLLMQSHKLKPWREKNVVRG